MDTFIAIADPTRRKIIELVVGGEHSSTEIATQLGIVPQTASQHLKVLLSAGVLAVRREGTRRLYSIEAKSLTPVADWLRSLQQ